MNLQEIYAILGNLSTVSIIPAIYIFVFFKKIRKIHEWVLFIICASILYTDVIGWYYKIIERNNYFWNNLYAISDTSFLFIYFILIISNNRIKYFLYTAFIILIFYIVLFTNLQLQPEPNIEIITSTRLFIIISCLSYYIFILIHPRLNPLFNNQGWVISTAFLLYSAGTFLFLYSILPLVKNFEYQDLYHTMGSINRSLNIIKNIVIAYALWR
ncbi:MAG TPA: hypothetical protein DCE41_16195 [Cytophagales bacterium]|nr:hypothetical protein [Cytophagales bacterium]HAA21434.1 hypothetical protein [Cytophagales bacterium]HAP58396.1 hypothetical protein [Cytophagales bacterium]